MYGRKRPTRGFHGIRAQNYQLYQPVTLPWNQDDHVCDGIKLIDIQFKVHRCDNFLYRSVKDMFFLHNSKCIEWS